MQASDTKTFQWRLGSLQSGAAHCLSAALIGATILLLALSFRGGINRGHDTTIVVHGAHFFNAVCAILSTEKHGTGRYVCAATAHRNMEAIGLGYEEATLARLGKGLEELGRETAFLNDALKKVFQTASLAEDGSVTPIGWAMDAGYMDFVDLAFRIFGQKVEALYLTFFLFLAASTALACIQFYDRFLVLFSLLSFQYVLFFFLHETGGWEVYSFTNPRFLSILAVIPLLHALFLILYQVRPSGRAILLFLPQAALMAAASDFRATAYWTVIALMVFCVLLVGATRWRQGWSYRRAVALCWPALPVLLCMAAATLFVDTTTDPRLVEIGGMKGHAFWQPIYYNLQLHPDWKKKYSDQHAGVTGDETAWVAVKAYRKRNHLESEPLTQVSYEEQTHAVFFEFIRNDPWYFIELKYFGAAIIVEVIKAFLSRVWASLPWPFLILAACTAVGLTTRVRTKAESLPTLTWCTVTVIALVAIVAAPTWVTVVTIYAIADTGIVAATAAFVGALWLAVSLAVLVINDAAVRTRLKANRWINRLMYVPLLARGWLAELRSRRAPIDGGS
jgi:hypothetical protein